jgi:hypothetical protein
MDIQSLQLKRVTGNWEKNKTAPTQQGEPILIEKGVIPEIDYPIIVLGKKDETIESVVNSDDRVFINRTFVNKCIETNNKNITSDSTPNAVAINESVGTSSSFSRSDHTHKIDGDTVKSVLKDATNGFEYHGIKVSTSPPTSSTPGNIGDIIVVYEDK